MRVLMVTDWNRGQGGAEAYAGWLRKGLSEAGDQVRLLTSSAGTMGEGTAEYVAYGSERIVAQTFLQIANPFAIHRVRGALAEFRPTVVVVNMFAHHLSPAILHAIGSVPLVLLVSDYKCICPIGSKLLPDNRICNVRPGWGCHTSGCVSLPHWVRDQPRYALLRSGISKARVVVSCSEWVRSALLSEGIESECVYLPVPAAGADYRRQPSEHPVFLYCGRLDREKGVDDLIRAFAELSRECPEARLRIAGRGPEHSSLVSLASELGMSDAVSFPGWLEPRDVEKELSRAWALVAPSLWAEPLGLVALEAIIRGVPVIATSSGGFSETVREGVSGFLVPNGDFRMLADRMKVVASRRAFPDQRVPKTEVDQMRQRHDIHRHIVRMREIFARAASGSERATQAVG